MSLCLHQLMSLCFWSVSWCWHARLCRCVSSGVQSETVVILYLTISSPGSWAVIGREPSSHMAKGILPNGELSSLTPFGVVSKFWILQTFGWTSLFFCFEALSQETSGQLWSLNYKGGFKIFFLPTPWNQLSSRTFLGEVCLECDKQQEQTQNGDEGVTLRHNSINEEVSSSRSVVTISEKLVHLFLINLYVLNLALFGSQGCPGLLMCYTIKLGVWYF